ncbi:MAG: antiporter NhaP2 [Cyanobacteriota bacterium]
MAWIVEHLDRTMGTLDPTMGGGRRIQRICIIQKSPSSAGIVSINTGLLLAGVPVLVLFLSVEINALSQVDGEIVDYTVKARARVAGQRLRDLALPDDVVVSLIVRGREVVMLRGTTALLPGDHVFVAMRIRLESMITRLFEPDPEPPEMPVDLSLSFHAATIVQQLLGFYGLRLPQDLMGPAGAESLGSLLAESTSCDGLSIGALRIKAGADPVLVTVSCTNQPA